MAVPRRLLPPISVLASFEAAARLENFTTAAQELSLTQSAVSRQINHLEELLGAPLFMRERQTVRLTSAGQAYAREIEFILQRLANATLQFRANPNGASLNLAVPPALGTRWLTRRLPQFTKSHPEFKINLVTRTQPFNFSDENLHAAIYFGAPNWSGAHLDYLFGETSVPVCSPEFLEEHKFEQTRDLLSASLIGIVTRPQAWEHWFIEQGVEFDLIDGVMVDQIGLALHSAAVGMGVAILPMFLIEEELKKGTLVKAIEAPVQSQGAYYLAHPAHFADYAPLKFFRDWLLEQAASQAEN